jgi:hypothetical protein
VSGPGAANPYTGVGSRSPDGFFQFPGNAPFTCVIWIKPDFAAIGGVFNIGICGSVNNAGGGVGATDGWSLTVIPTTLQTFFQRRDITFGGGTGNITDPTPLTTGAWHMIVAVYDGANLLLYRNGVLAASGVDATTLNATYGNSFYLGAVGFNQGFGGTWAPWKGWLDSCIVADFAITIDQVQQLYAAASVDTVAAFTGARVYNSVNESVPNNAATALTFDLERYDSANYHSSAVNPSRLTIPSTGTGKYSVGGCASFDANVNGHRTLLVRLNGAAVIAQSLAQAVTDAAVPTTLNVATEYALFGGDYVELVVYQNSGGPLNVLSTGNYTPEFWISAIK